MKDLEIVNKITDVVLAYRPSRRKKLKGIKRFQGKKRKARKRKH
jgi:hypothetical protein